MSMQNTMTRRDSIISRLVKMKIQEGEISRELIMADPLLDWYEVMREFGKLETAKKQVKQEMKNRGLISDTEPSVEEPTESPPEVVSESPKAKQPTSEVIPEKKSGRTATEAEFKEQMRAAFHPEEKEEPEMKKPKKEVSKTEVSKKTKSYNRGKRRLTTEEVWQSLLEYAKELGAVPKIKQIQEKSKTDPDFPCVETIRRHLGTDWQDKLHQELFPEVVKVTLEDDAAEGAVEPTVVEIQVTEPKEEPILPKGAKLFDREAKETGLTEPGPTGPGKANPKATDPNTKTKAKVAVKAGAEPKPEDEDDIEPNLIFDCSDGVPGENLQLAKEHIGMLLDTLDNLPPYIESWKARSELIQVDLYNGGTAFVYICAAK